MWSLGFSRARIIGLLAAIGLLCSTTVSFAQGTQELGADVVITGAPLSVSEQTPLDINVTGPGTGTTVFTLDPSDNSCTPVGGVGGICGSASAGIFGISGGEGATVAITANTLSCTAGSGVSISNITYYSVLDFTPFVDGDPIVIPVGGIAGILWGADFAITSAAVTTICTINVTVDFTGVGP